MASSYGPAATPSLLNDLFLPPFEDCRSLVDRVQQDFMRTIVHHLTIRYVTRIQYLFFFLSFACSNFLCFFIRNETLNNPFIKGFYEKPFGSPLTLLFVEYLFFFIFFIFFVFGCVCAIIFSFCKKRNYFLVFPRILDNSFMKGFYEKSFGSSLLIIGYPFFYISCVQ